MIICLFLKTDIEIGCKHVPILQTKYNPLYYKPYIKRYKEQFTLLSCMNKFMINIILTQCFSGKNDAKKINGSKISTKRMFLYPNNHH